MNVKNYLAIVPLVLLMACNGTEQKNAATKDSAAVDSKSEKTQTVNLKDAQLQAIYTDYLALKNALVATKANEAKTAAQTIAEKLKNYSGCENTAIIANKIASSQDIAEQRKQFTALSTDVIALFKHADLASGTIFVQHCPMANKGEGGDWLSSEKKIQNPYYGDEMMECGAVVEEIKTK